MEKLNAPNSMDFDAKNLSQTWKKWKEEASLYIDLAMDDKAEAQKVKLLLYLLGRKGREIHSTTKYQRENGNGEKVDIPEADMTVAIIIAEFDKHCDPKKNETVERYKFFCRNQDGDSFDKYIAELRILADTCNFGDVKESLIRDRIICGLSDANLRESLLRETELTLDKCIRLCRASEISKEQNRALGTQAAASAVNALSNRPKVTSKQNSRSHRENGWSKGAASKEKRYGAPEGPGPTPKKCNYCGGKHRKGPQYCKAFGHQCKKCKKHNHFEKMCQSEKVHQIELESDDYFEIQYLTLSTTDSVNAVDHSLHEKVHATMLVNGKYVKFQVDSGASCNILPKSVLKDSDILLTTNQILTTYNGSAIKPMGKCRLKMKNPKNKMKYKADFVILDDESMLPILGCSAAQQMNLITVEHENIMNVNSTPETTSATKPLTKDFVCSQYSDVFTGLGCFQGDYHLQLDPLAKPVIHPPRKVPLAIKHDLETEIQRLVTLGVIAPVTEPTPWVSSLVTARKPNGKLRICIDPQDLNRGLQRSHYPMPTIEDLLPDLSNAKCFSVLDAKDGFWHVRLDHESSLLTTFNTPFGRYRWLRMPFGLNTAPEEFQRRQDQAVEGLPGVRSVHDDILVYGKGDTEEEAQRDHDRNFIKLMERCQERNLKLNRDKMKFRRKEVKFIGHEITVDGLKADPEKVRAVMEMPNPTDVSGVRRFVGFVTYLAKFLPKLSDTCEPLRRLTQKNIEWHWGAEHDEAVSKVKKLVTSDPILQYFRPDKKLVLQCDASEKGLGATILQESKPIAYASRALTDTETRYAQIEKELLAVVFGLERFNIYTYGRPVYVQSDHRPLEIIFRKPLHAAPKRLQSMLLRTQKYEVHLEYRPGKHLELADTLSRAFLTDVKPTEFEASIESINMLQFLPIAQNRLKDIQHYTAQDPLLSELGDIIRNGWPNDKHTVPDYLQIYFEVRDELAIQNGIIFKGNRAVIPRALRRDMLERIHSSHLGIEGCLRRARESIYWPRMNAEAKDYISKCETCRTFDHNQSKESISQHDVPPRPWAKVGLDLFTFDDKNYLIVSDYFSNYFEIDLLDSTTSRNVINKLRAQFARHGIPDVCVSDNGPQFASEEFRNFAHKWEFEHITSSPHYPQSNGKAEQAVKVAKQIMRKAKHSKQDPYLALLDYRNTPTQHLGVSPVQRLMNRRTKTLLPTRGDLLQSVEDSQRKSKLDSAKAKQAEYYNRSAHDLPPLNVGDPVRVKSPNKPWEKGTVLSGPDMRSYNVKTESGGIYRRNRRHLRRTSETAIVANDSVTDLEPEVLSDEISEPNCMTPAATTGSTPPQDLPAYKDSGTSTISKLPVLTRSGRESRPPAKFRDYV